jgi:hypothetical protein
MLPGDDVIPSSWEKKIALENHPDRLYSRSLP